MLTPSIAPFQGARGAVIPMRKLTFAATALMLVALSAPTARGGNPSPTKCPPAFGAVTVSGDLVVPAGQSCTLTGTTITGNVTVRGSLLAFDVHIVGNLTADHAESLILDDSTVGGNLVADHTTGG